MDINYIKKEKNEIEFAIKEEDAAIYDLIIDCATNKRDVEFVSKKQEDKLKKEFVVYLRTKDKPAKDVLLECINEAEERLNVFLNNLEKAVKKNK
jgi:DNA-directed RNA polymerase subunit L